MKKFSLFLFLLISHFANSQTPYYDAIFLKNFSPGLNSSTQKVSLNGADQSVTNILGHYFPNATNPDQINLSENPFIEFSSTPQSGKIEGGGAAVVGKIGTLNVTTFADGLAQFLVDRAKQELDVAFFNKFKTFLENNPEAGILFPTTTDYISNFSIHEYALFIASLREAFYNDLKNLIYNVDDVFLLPEYVELIKNNPEIAISINCIQLIVDLEEGAHPVEVIGNFKNLDAWTTYKDTIKNRPALKNLHNGLKASYILANSVRTVENDTLKNWVSLKDFRTNILQDEITFRIFLGLIYQQADNEKIEFTFSKNESSESDKTISFTQYLTDNTKNLIVFQSLFLEIVQKGILVDQSIKEINETETPTREDYYKYINSSIDVIEFGFKLSNLLANNEAEDKYQNYFTLARHGNDLYRNIYEKQYSAAILNASSILTLTFEEVYKGKEEQKEKIIKVTENILRYGTFMANVIEAEEPSQVKAAIEAAVLPVGSSTVKKYYRHNFSVNAYIGAQFRKPAETVQQTWDAAMGFTAPVGFAYTPLSFGKGGAISVFVPLIDVGAIAQFRISDTTSQIEEDISLGNIFSPGGYLVYGMAWDLPISIGVGGQYGPGLVSFDTSTPNVINPSWRWNVFLAVDIPLFNLSKGKRIDK